ncbi:MAG TPA: SRPBCC family protein [Noviherbaspirillum sp.]|nr:SRPBCC family protein [Noviherbaspirillum sp.]
MATIQQSIDVHAPIHTVFDRLAHFEDYPRFMDEVQDVRRLDDTHWHWTTTMANRPVEWDAELTERQDGRCIAWRNVSGPTNDGRVEIEPIGQDGARVTFMLHSEPEQVPGSMAGNNEQELSRQLKLDMARLKDFIEAGEPHAAAPSRAGGHSAGQQEGLAESIEGERGGPRNAPVSTSSYAAGSEGFSGDEEPSRPVTSSARTAAELRNDSACASQAAHSVSAGTAQQGPQQAQQPEQGMTPGRAQHPAAAHIEGAADAEAGALLSGGNPGQQARPGTADVPQTGGPGAAAGAGAAGNTVLGDADSGAGAGDARSVPHAGPMRAPGGTVTGLGKGDAKA